MANTDALESQAAYALSMLPELPAESKLHDIVTNLAAAIGLIPSNGGPYSPEEIVGVIRTLQTKFDTRMRIGTLFEAEDYRPWLSSRQGSIDWYYWERYRKQLLTAKGFPPPVVRTLDEVTDRILDHLEDPKKEGTWNRRGLVVGHVQSGKTANYTGLVCKAADAGYQVIIILAGLLNSLRNQTQERIDSDFMGWCTRLKESTGVARFDARRRPVCFTSSVEDFRKNTANSIAMTLDALNEPVVVVMKKNKTTLETLHMWLSEHNKHNLREFSMLLIDDEADHASVNTNEDDKDPTAINRAIRNLLSLFGRSSFVGYTATPFANIFIDPESVDEMQNGEVYGDLFPRDFILSLDPPDNYIGPHRMFTDDADIDCVRPIDDNEDLLPIRHKIDHDLAAVPKSLEYAIDCFIIARAIRILRGHRGKHYSMMVNASRFTRVQNQLRGLVLDRVKGLRESIGNYAALPPDEACRDSLIWSLHSTWKSEYSETEFSWPEIQVRLKESVDPVEVVSVNSSSSDTLDYSRSHYPEGRAVIAIGGLGLSRGLTLEGLLVSYFLRNSIMYDTLMQMGRWFGYRDGYADVCRIFMTDAAAAWYSYIADATEELRADFRSMERAKLTPLDFGLRVRSHPAALIVTARNKMRASKEVPVSIALAGRLAETSVILAGTEAIRENWGVLERTVQNAAQKGIETKCTLGWLWKGVPCGVITSAIESFLNHPECMLTYAEPLVEYIRWLETGGMNECDVLLRAHGTYGEKIAVAGYQFNPPIRKVVLENGRLEFTKRRVASKGDEQAGLSSDEIAAVKAQYGSTPPDRRYRAVLGRDPLFMINFVAAMTDSDSKHAAVIAPTYSISFPGDPGSSRRAEKLVQYRVNTVWWEKNYYMPNEEEEGDE